MHALRPPLSFSFPFSLGSHGACRSEIGPGARPYNDMLVFAKKRKSFEKKKRGACIMGVGEHDKKHGMEYELR